MHEGRSVNAAVSGGVPRTYFQAPSLFGLEHYGSRGENRLMGYAWGSLSADGGGDGLAALAGEPGERRRCLHPRCSLSRSGGRCSDPAGSRASPSSGAGQRLPRVSRSPARPDELHKHQRHLQRRERQGSAALRHREALHPAAESWGGTWRAGRLRRPARPAAAPSAVPPRRPAGSGQDDVPALRVLHAGPGCVEDPVLGRELLAGAVSRPSGRRSADAGLRADQRSGGVPEQGGGAAAAERPAPPPRFPRGAVPGERAPGRPRGVAPAARKRPGDPFPRRPRRGGRGGDAAADLRGLPGRERALALPGGGRQPADSDGGAAGYGLPSGDSGAVRSVGDPDLPRSLGDRSISGRGLRGAAR